ncbi:MAG TPA: methyltransferase [Gammaproteobacteria bacterium]|nr:methyltransferase [Gammaproteobacteria bacterium]
MIRKYQVIANFNRGSETYTKAAHLQSKVAKNLSYQLANITAEKILEIGCGTGLFTQHLIKAFPKADFLLTDISPLMIEQCRQQVSASANLKWGCMDGEQLDKFSSFDLITSSMTFHWFKEFEQSLMNIKQKLKKGGRLLFAILTENSLVEWRDMCRHFNYPIATVHFPSVPKLREQFPELNLRVEIMKETYSSAHAFLKILKLLGANAAHEKYIPLTPDKMRKLIRYFNHAIEVSYEVVYGEYTSR